MPGLLFCSNYIHAGEPKIFTEWVAWLQAVVTLVGLEKAGPMQDEVAALHGLAKLQSSVNDFKLLAVDIPEQVKNEKCEAVMASIMRGMQFLQKRALVPGDTAKNVEVVMKEADELKGMVIAKLQENKVANVTSANLTGLIEARLARACQASLPRAQASN